MGLDIGFGKIRTMPIGGTSSGCIYMPTFCADVGLDADSLWASVQGAAFIPPEDPAAMHRGHPLARAKLYVDFNEPGKTCIYNFPGFKYAAVKYYKRATEVEWIMPAYEALRAMPGMVYNQAIVTMYRDGTDAISWHNDKPKSIVPDSVVFDVSLGAERTFHVRKNATTGEEITQVMAHGSAIAFTTSFNETHQHAVLPAMAGAEPRASIVFRNIADVLNDEELVRAIAKAEKEKARRDKAKASKRASNKTK